MSLVKMGKRMGWFKAFIFLFTLFTSNYLVAGEWQKVSEQVLHFSGVIVKEDLEKFKEVFTPSVQTIIVNSPGGHTITGLRIGQMIEPMKLKVIVQGECLSACANYIFTAARVCEIKDGMVGFHGGLSAYVQGLLVWEQHMKYKNWEDHFWGILKVYLGVPKASQQEIEKEYELYQEMAQKELQFFKKVGVSPELFIRTQSKDKGVPGKNHSFLFPLPKTFEQYGYYGIIGEQDIEKIQNDPALLERAKSGHPPLIE